MESTNQSPHCIGHIGNKYDILQLLSCDTGEGKIYLVQETEGVHNYFVAKIPNSKYNSIENEIKILKLLNEKDYPYIIRYIDDLNITFEEKDKVVSRKCLILEYAPRYDLWDYINFTKMGFGERYSKVIFFKICKGIQAIHKSNICHRDIKPDNILFDKNFNPKIADFGLASENSSHLRENVGTFQYKAPEILNKNDKEREYDGYEVDIFSLGVTLIGLTTGLYAFQNALDNNYYYKNIKNGNKIQYWKQIVGLLSKKLSKKFKNLCERMMAYNPKDRPTIGQILTDDWFEEIPFMDQDQLMQYEKEINLKEIFEIKEKEIKECKQMILKQKKLEGKKKRNTKADTDNIKNQLFKEEIEPKVINYESLINYYIKIKNLPNPKNFMNSLSDEIMYKLESEIYSMKGDEDGEAILEVTFKTENEEEEEEMENSEDLKNENKKNNSFIIIMELFKGNDGYILKFTKNGGTKEDFLNKYVIITGLISDIYLEE